MSLITLRSSSQHQAMGQPSRESAALISNYFKEGIPLHARKHPGTGLV